MQIDCLLPASKVSFTKFGERYCLTQNNFPRGQSFYSNKYDGAAHHLCSVFHCSLLHFQQIHKPRKASSATCPGLHGTEHLVRSFFVFPCT